MRPSLLLLITVGSAYRTGKTKIQRREPWVVAERFCFEGRATFDYSIKTRGGTRMYVYGSKDQKSFREKVDKKSYQTLSMQKRFERADTEVVLTPGMTTSGDLKFAVDSGQTFVHVVIANFNASCNAICQDQFSCNAEFSKRCYGPVEAEYEMTFLDGAAEHGRDERGANILYGVFAALYALFVGLACAVEGLLVREDKRHATCRILFRSVWVSGLSIWFRMLHHAIYANDGKGAPKLVNAAMGFTLLADSGVLLSLALCAEGWRIVRRKIAVRGRIRVALLITTYVIAAACIWGWYVSTYKHSTSPSLRETAPGRGLVGLRVVAGFVVGARLLQQADRFLASKREFYQVLFFLIGGWSAVWPVALIAATVARPADKDMAFDGCLVVAEFLVQALLVYCCKPGSPLFPFHANVVNAAANPTAGLWGAARSNIGGGDPRFQSVSGGRGANTNSANQYVIDDGFEALHVRRLKHVWQHLSERLDAVEDSARELASVVDLADVDDDHTRHPGQPDTPTPLQSRRSTPRTEAAQDRAAELLAGSETELPPRKSRNSPPRTPDRSPRRPGGPDTPSASARRKKRSPPRTPPPEDEDRPSRRGGRQQKYGVVVGVTEQPAPASGVVVGVVTEQPGASSGGSARGSYVDQTLAMRRPPRPSREDGGSAPVSRRSSDAYSGDPASTEGADPRDEGTVRGERDVEKLAPP